MDVEQEMADLGIKLNENGIWNLTALFNLSQFMDYDYPPVELPKNSQITLIILYTVTAVLSLTGNLTVIVVLVFGHRSKTEIRKYLLNLAVSDICMAIFCIPFRWAQELGNARLWCFQRFCGFWTSPFVVLCLLFQF